MWKIKKIIKSISCFAVVCGAVTPLVFASFSSCANKSDFCLISQSTSILQAETQQLAITIRYIGKHDIKNIKSIELKNEGVRKLWICSPQTDIELNEQNEFTVNLRLKKEPNQIETIKFGFVITFEHEEGISFKTLDNLSVDVDYHTIEWINQSIINTQSEKYIQYNFQMSGTNFPNKIQAKIIGNQQEKLELRNTDDIEVDENHQFKLEIKTKNIDLPSSDNISFQLAIEYEIDGEELSKTLDLSYSYYYVSLQHTKTSSPYLWKDQQVVKFSFTIDLPESDTISKIDKVNMVFESSMQTGGLHLLTDQDIPVDEDNNFEISCVYDEIDQYQLFEDTKIHFDLSFTTSSLNVNDFHSSSISLKAFREQPYSGTLVKITAIDDVDVSIMNTGIEDVTGYNIQYILPSQPETKYNLGASGQSGDIISLSPGQSIEFKNDTNRWSTSVNDYLSFSFSGPVIVQGDITALLDGNGGQMTELTTNDVFCNAFEKTNVVSVSQDFLRATTISHACYSYMFEESELVIAPNLPSTAVPTDAYACMFNGCKYLQKPPEVLPSEIVPEWAYFFMFNRCEQLEHSPLIMAQKLGVSFQNAFDGMFSNCAILSTIYIPYWSEAFGDDAFPSWVSGVAKEGIFYYNGEEQTRGTSAIPTNWQIEKYE